MAQNRDQPERPRVEPEIIPPDRSGAPRRRGPTWPPPHGFAQSHGTQRVYVTRISPLGFALFVLAIGFLAAVFLFVLIGAALIWIPIVAVLVIIAFISRLFRHG